MDRTSINSKEIQADIEAVFKAFTDKKALEYWLAPYGMTGKIHNFDLKVGGGYEMSLYYNVNRLKEKPRVMKTDFQQHLWKSYLTRK